MQTVEEPVSTAGGPDWGSLLVRVRISLSPAPILRGVSPRFPLLFSNARNEPRSRPLERLAGTDWMRRTLFAVFGALVCCIKIAKVLSTPLLL